jgi:hypothetical protein
VRNGTTITKLGQLACLIAGAVLLETTALAQQHELVDNDNIRARVSTSTKLNFAPCGYRISWIDFDSGFRGSGLEIGDLVVAVGG